MLKRVNLATEVKLKQVQLSYGIAQGDLKTKLTQAKKFLDDGCRVKIEMRLKGRQNAHPDIALQKMRESVDSLKAPNIIVEKVPTLDGKNIIAQLKAK